MFVPSAKPSCSAGKASVMIAAEFAIRSAPPMAWTIRRMTSSSAPFEPVLQTTDKQDRRDREPGEAEVVHLTPAEHVADTPHGHHDRGRHQACSPS